jgi:hypothetical protein
MAKSKNSSHVTIVVPRKTIGLNLGALEEESLTKAFLDGIPGASRQDSMLGRKEHPFSFRAASMFKHYNVHHSACIEAKKSATVGLDFYREPTMEKVEIVTEVERYEDEKAGREQDVALREQDLKLKAKQKAKPVQKSLQEQPKADPLTGKPELAPRSQVSRVLDPLCDVSFLDVLTDVAEDFWQTGNGYIEVVRDESETPVALYHCPAKDVHVVLEDHLGHIHYEVQSSDGSSFLSVFAKFGDRKRLLGKGGQNLGGLTPIPTFGISSRPRGRPRKDDKTVQPRLTELIHFRRPTSFSRFYGYPDWLAAVLAIELKQCSTQHLYDFFNNRGVPEMIVSISGAQIPSEDWTDFKNALKAHVGLGNSHKTFAFQLPDPQAKLEVHKLAMEGVTEDLFTQLADVLASEVVSAHGVPPLLAGIMIPGKLGASNELANALMAFQALRVGPAQRLFTTILQNTLGQDFTAINEQQWQLRTILQELDIGQVATIGGMKQPLAQAKAEGRDLSAGMKD